MNDLIALVVGRDVPAHIRIWSALAPAILIFVCFLLGFLVFVIRSAVLGVPKDAETVKRGGSLLAVAFLRHFFFWFMRPVWAVIRWSDIPPTAITTLSALMGLGAGVATAAGRFALGGWLFIFSGMLDAMDGRLARERQQVTPWGAAIDSILDRLSDMAVLIGLSWYYRSSWVLLMCLVSMNGTALVPYIRARGESLGVTVKDGLAQRVERVLYLGLGVALSPILEAIFFPQDPHPMHWLAVVALVAMAITTNFTAVQRFTIVIRALKSKSGVRAQPAATQRSRLRPHLLTAVLATLADFFLMYTLVRHFNVGLPAATSLGCLLGAGVYMNLSRLAALRSPLWPRPIYSRYLFLSFTGLLLNLGGVAMIGALPAFPFPLNWVMARFAVHTFWTFPLHGFVMHKPHQADGLEMNSEP
jgi:phosphatidylglycerophosphate synthase